MLLIDSFRSKSVHAVVLVCLVVIGILYSLWLGVDRNYDLLNYHLYSPFALMEWRYDIDIFPASFHTYFNPLLDLPYYLTAKYIGLYCATALQGVFYGAFIFVVWLLSTMVFVQMDRRDAVRAPIWPKVVLAVSATLIGVTGAAALGQAGTTMNEVQVATIVLLAVWIMLRWIDRDAVGLAPCCFAGLLLGAAAALKLTAAIYAPGLVIAIVLASGFRRSLLPVATVCAGWAIAFAALYGWWGYLLYLKFESPTFPLFNGIFKSPWLPASSFLDNRFKPATMLEYIVYPYQWAFEASYRTSELSVRDPRLLCLIVSIGAIIIAGLFTRLERRIIFILAFGAVSYLIWLNVFSIYRYTIPLEVLSGILILVAISYAAALVPKARSVIAASCGIILSISISKYTISPDWGHVPLHETYEIEMKPVPDRSLVAIVGAPAGYLASLIPGRDLRFAGVGPWAASMRGTKVHDVLTGALRDKTVNRVAVVRLDSAYTELLASFGVALVETDCSPVRTSIDPSAEMKSCPLVDLNSEATTGPSAP